MSSHFNSNKKVGTWCVIVLQVQFILPEKKTLQTASPSSSKETVHWYSRSKRLYTYTNTKNTDCVISDSLPFMPPIFSLHPYYSHGHIILGQGLDKTAQHYKHYQYQNSISFSQSCQSHWESDFIMRWFCWHVPAKMSLGFLCLFLVWNTGKDVVWCSPGNHQDISFPVVPIA